MVAQALLATTSLFAILPQTAVAQSSAATVAAKRAYNIPSQSLDGALAAFSRVAGVQVLNKGATTKGVTSPGVKGAYTPQEAASRLLAGTGLTPRFVGANTLTVTGPASAASGAATVPGAIALDTINVQGDAAQSPYGPGVGYVATRSVAGTKIDTPIVETPQSIAVVTRQQIDDQQPLSVGQTTRYEAGTVTDLTGADTKQADVIVTRGFATTKFVDGLYAPNAGFGDSSYDPYMLDRVEILKGATAAVYGQTNPGGVLELVSKRPTEEPLHEVFVQGGSYGRIESGFDLSGPIDADKHWLYRLTGVGFDTGSQVDHVNLSRISIAPAITYQPDASTKLTILANYRYDPNAGFWNKLPLLGTLLPNAAGYKIPDDFFSGDKGYDTLRSRQASIGYSFEHTFDNDWTFRQNARFQHWDWQFDSVQADSLTGTTIDRDKFQDINSENSFVIDNQLQKSFDTGPVKHTALLGFDYQHAVRSDKETDAYPAPSLDLLNPDYNQPLPAFTPADTYIYTHQRLDQLGLYARDQLSFDNWRASIGVRQDWARSTTNDLLSDTTQKQSDSATTWNAGLLYLFDNGIAPYVSYSTSFLPTIGTDANSKAFEPTKGEQFEAGIKYQPTFMNALFTAAVFNLTQQNVLTQDPNNAFNQVQTGEIRGRGIELQAKASLTDNIDINAAYTYLDAQITKSNYGDVGNRPYNVPENTASLWATYRFDSGALSGLKVGGGVRYVGNTKDMSNTHTIPAFTLFDAMVSYDFGAKNPSLKGLSLAVNATNLFDKQYVQACTNGCYYGLRRNVMATLKYRW